MYNVVSSACGERLLGCYTDLKGFDLCLRFPTNITILRGIGTSKDIGTLERCIGRDIKRMIVEKVNLTPLNKNRFILRVSTPLSSHIVAFESVKDTVDIDVFNLCV